MSNPLLAWDSEPRVNNSEFKLEPLIPVLSNDAKISFRLPKSMLDDLLRLANKSNASPAVILRQLIEEKLEEKK